MSKRSGKKKNYFAAVNDIASWTPYLSETALIVVEVYSALFGPCENIIPTVQTIMRDIDDISIKWVSLNISKVVEEEAKRLNVEIQNGDYSKMTIGPKSSLFMLRKYLAFDKPKPLFLFMKHSHVIGELYEASPPLLIALTNAFFRMNITSSSELPTELQNAPAYVEGSSTTEGSISDDLCDSSNSHSLSGQAVKTSLSLPGERRSSFTLSAGMTIKEEPESVTRQVASIAGKYRYDQLNCEVEIFKNGVDQYEALFTVDNIRKTIDCSSGEIVTSEGEKGSLNSEGNIQFENYIWVKVKPSVASPSITNVEAMKDEIFVSELAPTTDCKPEKSETIVTKIEEKASESASSKPEENLVTESAPAIATKQEENAVSEPVLTSPSKTEEAAVSERVPLSTKPDENVVPESAKPEENVVPESKPEENAEAESVPTSAAKPEEPVNEENEDAMAHL